MFPNSTIPPLHWVFLQYHKSGHDFTQKFSLALHQHCHTSSMHDENKRKNNMEQHYSTRTFFLTKNDVYVTVPGAFAGNWSKVFQSPGHNYRIVHLVRDPFDLILSAYLFHSEDPPPEQWIKYANAEYCSGTDLPAEDFLRTTAPYLGAYHGNQAQVHAWIATAHELCLLSRKVFHPQASYQTILLQARFLPEILANASYLAHFPSSWKATLPLSASDAHSFYRSSTAFYSHNATLYGPDLYPAIRVQALHSLFSTFGDLLHMAVTRLFEEPRYVMSVTLADFGINNRTVFRSTAQKVLSFLLPASKGGEVNMTSETCQRSALCRCFHLEQAVDLMEQACYVDEAKWLASKYLSSHGQAKAGQNTLASHITAGLLPSETMQMYKTRLAADPILGPLLSFVAKIIHAPPSPDWKRLIDTAESHSTRAG